MTSRFMAAGFTALAILYVLFKCFNHSPLSKIRGPKSPSFILGNLLELFQQPVGQADFEWQRLFGGVVRFKTVFGVDQLLVADPKAIQRVFSPSSYRYSKQPHLRVVGEMIHGKGIFSVDGEDHKCHRKILSPGFGARETRAFMGIFQGCAESICTKWMEIIVSSGEQRVVINIPTWISLAALDAIGQAAFGVQFDTIHNNRHPLASKYRNMMSDIFGRPSAQQIFIQAFSKYVPMWVLEWLTNHGSNPRLVRAREVKEVATVIAKDLVREKAETLLAGKENKDIFSLLVKANMEAEATNRLSEEELLSQMRTILIAGHETTSNTFGWILLELARHPEMQSRLRTEIREMEAAIRARGDTQFTTADFDAMHYATAVIKEGLRYHCVVPHVQRMASGDDILPLSRPITTETGETINEVFVPKGTRLVVSIAAYNRNTDLWGEDAHEFNPDRWADSGSASRKKPVSVGVYSNLMTFMTGVRACLGWRFAVMEIQAFLVEIIGKFEFTLTDQAEKISREPSVIMVPMVKGELERGSQVPLAVSIATREDVQ